MSSQNTTTTAPTSAMAINRDTLFTLAMKGEAAMLESALATNAFNINQLYVVNNSTEKEGHPFSGLNLLMVACKYGRNGVVKALVQNHRVNVNAHSSKETRENTATGIAAALGNTEVVSFLQSTGADLNAKNTNGDAPLHLACAAGKGATAELLLEREAAFDNPNKAGETPLMLAAKSGLLSVVQMLIRKRANIRAVAKNGQGVMHFAAQSGNAQIVQALVAQGASITEKCRVEKMPVDYCSKDNKTCIDVFTKELAKLQKKADEYSKSFMNPPKKKQPQERKKVPQCTKKQQRQQQRQKKEALKELDPETEKEKTPIKEEENEEDYTDSTWTVVKGQKSKKQKPRQTKQSTSITPPPPPSSQEQKRTSTHAGLDDNDDANTDEEDLETSKEKVEEEELTLKELQERVRKLEGEVRSFNSRHTKARKLKAKMNVWEKSLASTPEGEALDITVSHVMESIFGSKNLSLLSPSQLCALEELHINAIRNISQAKIIQAQKQEMALIQEQNQK